MWRQLLGRRFWIPAYLLLAAGLLIPTPPGATQPLIAPFLGGILFFTALKVSSAALRSQVATRRKVGRLAAITATKLVLLPLAVWSVTHLIAPEWAAAAALVSAMPAGLSSAPLAELYRGNLPLALTVVLTTSLIAPVSVPLMMEWLTGAQAVDLSRIADRVVYVAVLLIAPFILSRLVSAAAPRWVAQHQARFGPAAILSLFGLVFVGAATARPAVMTLGATAVVEGLVAATALAAAFWGVALIAKRMLAPRDAVAFACNTLYVNHGLAVAFASQFFPDAPRMLLVALLLQVPIVGAITLVGVLIPVRDRPNGPLRLGPGR